MSLVLVIDTAAAHCAVAVFQSDAMGGGAALAERREPMLRGHAERLFPLIEAALSEARVAVSALDAIAVCTGPGGFTGARIGVAAARGLATVIWSYPRGETLSKDGETAMDVTAYAAQIAALLGAHIIKIKLCTDHLEQKEAKKVFQDKSIAIATQADRVAECVRSAFNGRRIMVFSGGAAKGENAVFDDARAIRDGGGNGSIIGRNSFQRKREDALAMLAKLVEIYKGRG